MSCVLDFLLAGAVRSHQVQNCSGIFYFSLSFSVLSHFPAVQCRECRIYCVLQLVISLDLLDRFLLQPNLTHPPLTFLVNLEQ